MDVNGSGARREDVFVVGDIIRITETFLLN